MNARSMYRLATLLPLLEGIRRRFRTLAPGRLARMALPGLALMLVSGCLLDLEGGPARVQVRANGTDTLVALTIDAWRHDFVPLLAPGKTSETIELPVSGRLEVALWGRRDGRDTVMSRRTIEVGVGEFLRLE